MDSKKLTRLHTGLESRATIDRDIIASTGLENEIGISRTPQSIQHIDLHDEKFDERERVIGALEQSGWVQAKQRACWT